MAAKTRALLEVLRVPLLASPVGDVSAGFLVASATAGHDATLDARLGAACLAGVALLAAGMAQNALADADDDATRKPERPMPRGDVGRGEVRALFTGCLAVAALVAWTLPALRGTALAIVALTAAYHYVLKRWRVPGCLALGGLRALDVGLGVALAGGASAGDPATLLMALYGLFVLGASLHASTDDEPARPTSSLRGLGAHPASPVGLGLCATVLLAGAALLVVHAADPLGGGLAVVALAWAATRILGAVRAGPPGRVTGAALGSLLLLTAATASAFDALPVALVLIVLMLGSRRLLAVFPPS